MERINRVLNWIALAVVIVTCTPLVGGLLVFVWPLVVTMWAILRVIDEYTNLWHSDDLATILQILGVIVGVILTVIWCVFLIVGPSAFVISSSGVGSG